MYRLHTLPTKPTKDETEEESGGKPARSVEDSLVMLQALRQSRQTWLTSAFVKFSTKSRGGKGSEVWQPPHTIRFRGKCDLEIGPHVFYSTSVYEVTYQPYQVPVQAPQPYYTPSSQTYPGWPAGPYTYPSAPQTSSSPATTTMTTTTTSTTTTTTPTAAQVYAPSTTALVSSLKGAVPITNELIAQVNTAAVTNPTLANLLGLAASGSATPEQLQTLGVTIQSLAESGPKPTTLTPPQAGSPASNPPPKVAQPAQQPIPPPRFQPTKPSKAVASAASQPSVLSLRPSQTTSSKPTPGESVSQPSVSQQSSQPAQMRTINKDPDVVIEFYENSYDRWILPKDLVLYEKVKRWDGNSSLADIIFSTICPFEGFKPPATAVGQATSSPAGAATETPQPNKDIVHPITLRFFNVPAAIWNMFSKAAGDEERTKRVRAAMDAQLDKAAPRAYLQHRIAEGALLTQLQAAATDRYLMKSIRPTTTTGQTPTKRRAPATTKNNKEGTPSGAPPLKKKKTTPAKKPEPVLGKCEGCLRSPVALVPDTPYCPTCDKAKKTRLSFMSPAAARPTTPKAKASSVAKPAGSANNSKQPMPTVYTGLPSVQSYYAWQNQPQYIYQYQPQPQGQPQQLPSQPTPPLGTTSQPGSSKPSAQPPAQPTPSQKKSTTPNQSKTTVSTPKNGSVASAK